MIPSDSNIHSTDVANLDAQLETRLETQLEALAPPSPAGSSAPPAQLLAAARRERSARRTTATVCAVPALLALGLIFTQLRPHVSTLPATSPQLEAASATDLPPATTLAAITLANAEGPITLGTLRLPTRPAAASNARSTMRTFRVLDSAF